jgi:hypothetical protein
LQSKVQKQKNPKSLLWNQTSRQNAKERNNPNDPTLPLLLLLLLASDNATKQQGISVSVLPSSQNLHQNFFPTPKNSPLPNPH